MVAASCDTRSCLEMGRFSHCLRLMRRGNEAAAGAITRHITHDQMLRVRVH